MADSAAAREPTWAEEMLTADASGRASCWAFARRGRSGGAGRGRGQTRAAREVGVQRDGDRGEDADDRDDDHQLDEGEAALVTQHLTVPEPVHCSSSWNLVALRPSMEVELLLKEGHHGHAEGQRLRGPAAQDSRLRAPRSRRAKVFGEANLK